MSRNRSQSGSHKSNKTRKGISDVRVFPEIPEYGQQISAGGSGVCDSVRDTAGKLAEAVERSTSGRSDTKLFPSVPVSGTQYGTQRELAFRDFNTGSDSTGTLPDTSSYRSASIPSVPPSHNSSRDSPRGTDHRRPHASRRGSDSSDEWHEARQRRLAEQEEKLYKELKKECPDSQSRRPSHPPSEDRRPPPETTLSRREADTSRPGGIDVWNNRNTSTSARPGAGHLSDKSSTSTSSRRGRQSSDVPPVRKALPWRDLPALPAPPAPSAVGSSDSGSKHSSSSVHGKENSSSTSSHRDSLSGSSTTLKGDHRDSNHNKPRRKTSQDQQSTSSGYPPSDGTSELYWNRKR